MAVRIDVDRAQLAVNVDDAGAGVAARRARAGLRAVLSRTRRPRPRHRARHRTRPRARARPRARLRRHDHASSRAPRAARAFRSCCPSSKSGHRESDCDVAGLVLVGASLLARLHAGPDVASAADDRQPTRSPSGCSARPSRAPTTDASASSPSRCYIVDATGHLAPSSRIVPSPPALDVGAAPTHHRSHDDRAFAGYTRRLPEELGDALGASCAASIGYIDLATPLSKLSRGRRSSPSASSY